VLSGYASVIIFSVGYVSILKSDHQLEVHRLLF